MKRSVRRVLVASVLATSALATACPPPWAWRHERRERRDDHHDRVDDHRGERKERHDDNQGDRKERHDDNKGERHERKGDRLQHDRY